MDALPIICHLPHIWRTMAGGGARLGEARLFMVEAGCPGLGLRQHPRLILRHLAAITLALTISGGK